MATPIVATMRIDYHISHALIITLQTLANYQLDEPFKLAKRSTSGIILLQTETIDTTVHHMSLLYASHDPLPFSINHLLTTQSELFLVNSVIYRCQAPLPPAYTG